MTRRRRGTVWYFISIGWLLSSLWLSPVDSVAQFAAVNRLEIPLSSNADGYTIASNDAEGLILLRLVTLNSGEQVELIHVDTSFQTKWVGYMAIEKGWQLVQYYSDTEMLHLLFTSFTRDHYDFRLMQVQLSDRNYVTYAVTNAIPFYPTNFKMTGRGALIGGYYSRVPVVLFFDRQKRTTRILPGMFNEPGELTEIVTNDDDTFSVLISAKNYQRQRTIWIKSYSEDGNLQQNAMLTPGEGSLLFGRTVKTEAEGNIIVGVYGNRNGEYSRGLFIARVSTDGQQDLRYYNYGDLENFFNYMKASRKNRIKGRIERKKIKGKKIRLSYRFLVHELVPYKDQFIMLGEAFYPKYRSYYGASYGRASQMIFDGFQYTHAVVMGIDMNGNLIWDNSFEINDVRTFVLKQYVKMDPQEDQVALLYIYDNELRSKIIRDNEVLEGLNHKNLSPKSSYAGDDRERVTNLDYWFKNTFYAYGTRNKAPLTGRGNRERGRVFFINKITFRQ